MNSELSLTRRDVVTIVLYATLGFNVSVSLLLILCLFAFSRIPMFKVPGSSGNFLYYAVNAGVSVVFALALLPFISLIANGIVGRNPSQTTIRRAIISLSFRCVGLGLFVTSFPHFIVSVYSYLQLSGSSATSIRPFYLQNIASMLVCLSIGFALAFFPAIFASFRGPEEETAA